MSLIVRVVAPTGKDGELIATVLRQNGITSEACGRESLPLDAGHPERLGPLLIAEEALAPGFIQQLSAYVQGQPDWSDLPLLILTGSGRETSYSQSLAHRRQGLGSTILLERPIRTATLVSSVRAALQARARQFQIKDALEELKREREMLQVVLDNLPLGVVVANASGEIVLHNRTMEKILRHPYLDTPDIAAHGKWHALHPDGRPLSGEEYPLPRAMRSGKPLPPEEYVYRRGDGTEAWLSFAAAPILNDKGEVTGGVVALSDIDAQKRAETALIQSEKLAAVGRLAASISHEINNPLEAVTNLLYLSAHHEGVPDQARAYLAAADQELRRVSQIVNHTLRFHRQSTRPRNIAVQELLAPSLGLFHGRMVNCHIKVDLQDRGAGTVPCYEGEIRQVLNNLLGNAIDAMKTGGTLTVRIRDARGLRHNLPGVRITIADRGHGMAPETVSHIFDAFYTTKGIHGTGLGLWISRGIVEKHHGLLQVRSRVGSGTVFSLFLPANLAP